MSSQISSLLSGVASDEVRDGDPSLKLGSSGAPLLFDNIHNLRDLGGLHGHKSRRIGAGRLFRSGNPGMASSNDIDKLRTLGLDVVIDFRAAEEKSDEECRFADAFDWMALPVLEGSMSMTELVPRLRSATRQEMDDFMLQLYRDFPIKHQAAFGRFMKEAQTGRTLLYHCSTGKDRAGFATLLLLSALDVAPDVIFANYMESNRRNRGLVQGLLTRLASLEISPDVAMPLLEVRPAYLQAALEIMRQQWGSTERFVNEALAVDVEELRAHYLE
ncbi:tyrosine-protein phosphatase [Paraburkholderia adhaesiva]|uniref:tyrosine-protein phosphatase n=1 Tax=Paraburkholderia adhaesiva TaxID=2883244 RepID=UPI001F47054B|nr:tyrosine-protein phosphatase [Paraburkholderia adhaesiva]